MVTLLADGSHPSVNYATTPLVQLVHVVGLVEPESDVEIEAASVLPDV